MEASGKTDSPAMLSVTVCVCTRNRCASLGATIESIFRCTTTANIEAELIVVDNGSTDATPDVLKQFSRTPFPFRPVAESEPGLSRARNRAAKESRSEVLLFTDDDVLVPEDWILGMTAPFADPNVHAVQGRVHLHPDYQHPWMERLHRQFMAEFDDESTEKFVGANFAVRKRDLEEIGGFDPNLGAGTPMAFGEDSLMGLEFTRRWGPITVYRGDPVLHCPETQRLTRQFLFKRMVQQTNLEVEMIKRFGGPVPDAARRPVWANRFLMAIKVLKDRLLHPGSPATEAEICAIRSVRLSELRHKLTEQ